MTPEQASILLQKYLDDTASPEEVLLIENWYAQLPPFQQQGELETDYLGIKKEMWANVQSRKEARRKKPKLVSWYKLGLVAAVLTAVSAIAVIYATYYSDSKNTPVEFGQAASSLAPGKNSATLTLANGKKIVLSDAASGELAKEAGLSIIKTSDGKVVYKVENSSSSVAADAGFNTLSTARGEQYMVELPDKSRVWLNAASSIRYPVNFYQPGKKDARILSLWGEAYFEVSKDKTRPFVVKTDQQELVVTGTHFNINSYSDEPFTKTTLIEGSVKVSALLKDKDGSAGSPAGQEKNPWIPLTVGHQSVLKNGIFSVEEVDPLTAIDWKDGKFIMDNESLPSILRKISRWYNVEIEYRTSGANKITFSGTVSRTDTAAKLLKLLQRTGNVDLEISGNKIIVK